MLRITAPDDIASSPKKQLLLDFNAAFARADAEALLAAVSETVVWKMAGARVASGKEEFRAALEELNVDQAEALEVGSIVVSGAEAACEGVMRYPDGEAVAFADFYRFEGEEAGAKIAELRSYGVDLEEEEEG